ncbi:MAG: hypothetical protein JWM59_4566 [Verrucomicrobiales bacterium]|nr:hypothetical protein [Verrucomicrobiales bacterium]
MTQLISISSKWDVMGPVRTSARQREALMDEFEHRGLSGPKLAETDGVCYQTFAGWMQKRTVPAGRAGLPAQLDGVQLKVASKHRL